MNIFIYIFRGNFASLKTSQFPENETSNVDLTVSLNTVDNGIFLQGPRFKRQIPLLGGDVGPSTIYLPFQYRPNPVIRDIQPRRTFLKYV